jgi:rRNA-processing protein FCF1
MSLMQLIARKIKKIFRVFHFEIIRENTYNMLLEKAGLSDIEKPYTITVYRAGLKNKNKVVGIIEHPDLWLESAGFCAIFHRTLNALYFCDMFNIVPVITGWDSCPYFDGFVNSTSVVFEYYFKPVSDISIEDARTSYSLVIPTSANLDVALFDFGNNEWYKPSEPYISSMGNMFKKYIRLNDCISGVINYEIEKLIKYRKTLGIHFRGTDYAANTNGHPVALTYNDYKEYIDNALEIHKYEQIFVATDDTNFITNLKRDYCGVVIYTDVFRTMGNIGIHFSENHRMNHKYRLGYEVIRDAYTLAKCDGLIAGESQVSVFARIIKSSKEEKFESLSIISKGINRNGMEWMDIYPKARRKNGKR